MLRSYGMVVGLMIMGSAVTACGDRDSSGTKAEPVDTWAPLDDAGALVGRWSDGNTHIRFDRGGSYQLNQGGGNELGKWTAAHGKIMLNPPTGNDESYTIIWGDRRNSLELRRINGSGWRLTRD